jgi:hypothetical protein
VECEGRYIIYCGNVVCVEGVSKTKGVGEGYGDDECAGVRRWRGVVRMVADDYAYDGPCAAIGEDEE